MKNRQKWLAEKIKGEYIENEDLIRIVMFETFLYYIKEELSVMAIFRDKKAKKITVDEFFDYDWKKDLENGYATKEQVKSYISRQKELKKAYYYIVEEREILNKEFYRTMQLDEAESIEKEIEQKDQRTLGIILKHRLTLWT
jgi:hypothetical protein